MYFTGLPIPYQYVKVGICMRIFVVMTHSFKHFSRRDNPIKYCGSRTWEKSSRCDIWTKRTFKPHESPIYVYTYVDSVNFNLASQFHHLTIIVALALTLFLVNKLYFSTRKIVFPWSIFGILLYFTSEISFHFEELTTVRRVRMSIKLIYFSTISLVG
jgi:hypothetical protein